MRRLATAGAVSILLAGCAHAGLHSAGAPAVTPVGGARQLLLVTTPDWSAVPGTLRRYERASASAPWREVGGAFPIVVGRTGLAWGIGLHGAGTPAGAAGPVKREGDGKSPAGVFRLGPAFGYAPATEVAWIRMPYVHSTADVKCPDDTASRSYNQLVDQTKVARDWKSAEDMRLSGDAYRLGLVVQHNWGAQTRPGGGSCIFLHIWGGPAVPTVGCTAMAPENIEALLRWLDPAAEPVLVQLPAEEYQRLKSAWALP